MINKSKPKLQFASVPFKASRFWGVKHSKQPMTKTTRQKRGQSQLIHMSHQFEMHNEKQVKMGDIKGGMGVLGPVLPMKLAV